MVYLHCSLSFDSKNHVQHYKEEVPPHNRTPPLFIEFFLGVYGCRARTLLCDPLSLAGVVSFAVDMSVPPAHCEVLRVLVSYIQYCANAY